jgi:signal transduction histidine kinase
VIPQFGRLVTVSVMVGLVALFTWIYRRDRQQRVRLWMIGWSAILVHFAAALLNSFHLIPKLVADWVACTTLVAAGTSFLLSVCATCSSLPRRWAFGGGLVTPAIVYVTLLIFDVTAQWPYLVILGLMGGAVFYLAQAGLRQAGVLGWAVALAGGSALGWCAWMVPAAPDYGFDLMLLALFAATGYFFWRRHDRLSPGITLTALAFLCWGCVFPLGSLAHVLHISIPDDHVVWDLPKYAVAFGMILSLFENQAELLRVEVIERRRAEDLALAASDAKSNFLAHMSHEIRTPMSGIIGMTELVLDSAHLPHEERDNLELVKTTAESLLLVINEVLDLSKIEAGKLTFERIEFSPQELVRDLARMMRLRAEQKGLILEHEISAAVPAVLRGDPGRLRQVLLNLVSNAIKFTERGYVRLKVEAAGTTEAEGAVLRFSVSDSGIGIPAEKRASIFEPFNQADSSIARRFGGTGLGLTIAAELVALMGGKLSVEPAPANQGSIFHFDAGFELGAEGAAEKSEHDISQLAKVVAHSAGAGGGNDAGAAKNGSARVRPLRILLAEDNVINQKVATRLMERQGYSVTVAASGGQAIACLNHQTFDVVLMDIHMPGMDGMQVTRLIRDSEQFTGQHIPIIAVTALAMKGDAEKCLAAGMDAYISKPIEPNELFGKIREFV